MTATKDTIDAFHHIVQDTRVAQQDLLRALDRIESLDIAEYNGVVRDIIALVEPTLWKLSVRITRISARATDAVRPLQDILNDELDDELAASADRSRTLSDEPDND